jgi:predicted house-cleaning NTP pyrophosphatase (Maf/HAM1 superfamily)
MSPTSRRLRKSSKSTTDDKLGLHETKTTLAFGEEEQLPLFQQCNHSQIFLGSSSVSRRKLLEENNWKFTTLESNVDLEAEIGKSTDSPVHVALTMAHAMKPHFEDADESVVLLTVAQVIKCNDSTWHPPQTAAEAEAILLALSEQRVTTVTAVVATICPGEAQVHDVDECVLSFSKLSPELVSRVIKRNFSAHSSGLPLNDPELKLRRSLLSGSLDSALGMPLLTSIRVIEGVLNGGMTEDRIPSPPHESEADAKNPDCK